MTLPDDLPLHPDTLAIRSGIERSQFGEHGEAMYLTSSFVFRDAAQIAGETHLSQGDGPLERGHSRAR